MLVDIKGLRKSMEHNDRMSLGVDGFTTHPWPSVERTRKFYERALNSEFSLRQLDGLHDRDFHTRCDAILSFHSLRCWQLTEHPKVPLLFALHGGAILHQEFLRAHLRFLQTSDVLLVNCTSDITIMRKFFGDASPTLYHLPLPVDTTLFHPRDQRECRRALSAENYDYILGFVGRLLPQRNLHQFLYLLAELKQRIAPKRVAGLIVGNYWVDYPVLAYVTDEYPKQIRELIQRHGLTDDILYFPAGISDDDLASCYGAMDILVHPTNALDENFGYVPLEAMACGTPVIGAAYGGLKDTVISGENGFLLKTWVTGSGIRLDLINGFEHAVLLLEDAPLRARMSEAGVRRAREVYSEEDCGKRLRGAVKTAKAKHAVGDHRSVSLLPAPSAPRSANLLPSLEYPWEYYQNAVADYVSGQCPLPTAHSKLRLAAPLEGDEGVGFRLLDPAWPATFRLNKTEMALVESCRSTVMLSNLSLSQAEHALLKRLIVDGLIICAD